MPQAQPLGRRIPRPQKLARAPHRTRLRQPQTRSAPRTWIQRQHPSRTKFHGVRGARAQVNSRRGLGGPRPRAGGAAAGRQPGRPRLAPSGDAAPRGGWKEVLGDHSPGAPPAPPPASRPAAPPPAPRTWSQRLGDCEHEQEEQQEGTAVCLGHHLSSVHRPRGRRVTPRGGEAGPGRAGLRIGGGGSWARERGGKELRPGHGCAGRGLTRSLRLQPRAPTVALRKMAARPARRRTTPPLARDAAPANERREGAGPTRSQRVRTNNLIGGGAWAGVYKRGEA